jgi:hypothetical protein
MRQQFFPRRYLVEGSALSLRGLKRLLVCPQRFALSGPYRRLNTFPPLVL